MTLSSAFCVPVLLLFVAPAVCCGQTRAREPSPKLVTERLPSPPQQQAYWKPPATKLSPSFVSATALLFEQGFADPRGCEYREIKVGVGSCWSGDGGVVLTHGWVLPAASGEATRFAVCWNGLVYPVVSVGEPKSYSEDIQELIASDKAARKRYAEEHPDREYRRWWRRVVSEGSIVSHESLLPIKTILLLRLGEAELAERVADAWSPNSHNLRIGADHEDPYLSLAADWAWASFDRAVCAHMRGDDKLALATAEQIASARKMVEKTARERGLASKRASHGGVSTTFRFLEPIDALLADQRRRASAGPAQLASKIDALIADLENVGARQMGQPGGVGLASDPRVQAVVELGMDAVEPLLETLESDTRLTRSVSFHRDFFENRNLITVQAAAYAALSKILRKSFSESQAGGGYVSPSTAVGRKQLASRIRSHVERFKETPLAEQWRQTLADDMASPDEWLQAAKNMVSPAQANKFGCTREGDWIIWDRSSKPMAGESLRAHTDPSLSDLLIKRLADTSALSASKNRNVLRTRDLLRAIAKWDSHAAKKAAADQALRSIALFEDIRGQRRSSSTLQYTAELIGVATTIAAGEGEASVLKEYSQWLRRCSREDLEDATVDAFAPLWRFPDDPVIESTAEWIFHHEDSPWNPLVQPDCKYRDVQRLFESPLVTLPSFQRQAARMLRDKQVVGHVKAKSETRFDLVRLNWSGSESTYEGDPLAIKMDEQLPIRLCDVYADLLSRLDGTPGFAFFWPEGVRDKAVDDMAHFLLRYGGRLRPSRRYGRPSHDEKPTSDWRNEGVRLLFEPLRKPATQEMVERGDAIFSLGSDRPTRVWKLPDSPIEAVWITSYQQLSPGTHQIPVESESAKRRIHVLGSIWQAEELLEDGVWRRLFGFVGQRSFGNASIDPGVVRIAAEDVRLGRNGRDFGLRIEPAWSVYNQKESRRKVLRVGDPLLISCSLRNLCGTNSEAPVTYCRATDDGMALLEGVQLDLQRQPAVGFSSLNPQPGGTWSDASPKPSIVFADDGARTRLDPFQAKEIFRIDLQDWFVIDEPGHYRLTIAFAKDSQVLPQVLAATIYFMVESEGSGEN